MSHPCPVCQHDIITEREVLEDLTQDTAAIGAIVLGAIVLEDKIPADLTVIIPEDTVLEVHVIEVLNEIVQETGGRLKQEMLKEYNVNKSPKWI